MRLERASGILLHPTSLPGPHGSGDFGPAAYHFVDWLAAAGQKLWQILPLGGIGPGNSPYMSTSAFAGNLLLVDLAELVRHGWLQPDELAPPPGISARCLEFGAVVPFRMDRLARAAQRFADGAGAAERTDFEAFRHHHAGWLRDYALFMALAERQGWRDWCDWDAPLAAREPAALQAAGRELAERVQFYEFGQWCFFRQWGALKAYANRRGVKIVGDAPIFIAYQSAEVWARRELFELGADGRPTVVAGVPPDAFSATGQRWGNPLYRWSAHAAEGYAWWTQRIRGIFELVDIVRIDHFRGFAGYWEIPASEPTAMVGRWVSGPGPALFEAIARSLGPLPIIAEDLGVITPDVLALRKQFDFPGMRILHFAFDGGSGNTYLPHNHEPDAVVYTGTHDNDTTLGWWASLDEAQRERVRDYLGSDGQEIHWDLLRAACASVADTAIHPLQDVLGLDGASRMNFPGFGAGYWTWRFDWAQVQPMHAERLAHWAQLYRRDGTPLQT
ncbi:4-alpha-glucanotransferase [Piscinibacter defluvii]|uniref:4-alpha-glucanotransferase n=1 Tax=Piscinibacter defluvii TaxID=1796922 RepID=UPI000FDF57B0|nr:4-alpha-glucanotransferase [Piscinibacter defluvii]